MHHLTNKIKKLMAEFGHIKIDGITPDTQNKCIDLIFEDGHTHTIEMISGVCPIKMCEKLLVELDEFIIKVE